MRLVTGTATVDDLEATLDDLARVGDRFDCTLQAIDARYVAGPEHLRRAVELADRARARDEAIARERAVEVLLYAAGRRQINRALEMGIETGETPTVVVVAACPASEETTAESVTVQETAPSAGTSDSETTADRERSASAAVCALPWFEPGPVETGDPDRLRSFFDVSETELAATDADLADLVCERVALLVVER